MQKNRTLRTLPILLVVVGGVALMGVRNVRAKIARSRIMAAQEMAESFCLENHMSDHRMSEPPNPPPQDPDPTPDVTVDVV